MSNVIDPLIAEQMKEMRRNGYLNSYIAKELGYNDSTVQKYTQGIVEYQVPSFTDDEIRKIRILHKDKQPLMKIVHETGRTKASIRYALANLNNLTLSGRETEMKAAKEEAKRIRITMRTKEGLKVIPKGYVGLRTPTHPDGRW